MTRFSTIIFKSRILLLLCVLTSTLVSVYADEYKSMIRYDRVWEHIWVHWDNTRAYYVKFNGEEKINGKNYHMLTAFKKTGYAYDDDRQVYLFDTDENCFVHEGYIREEDGRVYTLVICESQDDEYYEPLRWSPKREERPYVKEKLLYDFTCKEGESYRGLHVSMQATEMTYKVKSVEYVEIDGEQHLLQRIQPENYDYIELTMVEGIGIDSEYGCLTTINFLDLPTCPCVDHIFNRVLSMDGHMIYGSEEGYSKIPVGDFLGVGYINQTTEDDNPIYDVMGRRISTPAPGQLYIQGGQKMIAHP